MKNSWIEELLDKFGGAVSEIDRTWADIGYSESQLDELRGSLEEKCFKELQGFLVSGEKEKSKLKEEIQNIKADITKIEIELQIRHKQCSTSLSLFATLKDLKAYYHELQDEVAELSFEFKKVKSHEEYLCTLLGVAPMDGFPLIPSFNDKLRVQNRVSELENLKLERQRKVCSMKGSILDCMNYFKSDCTVTLPDSIRDVITSNKEASDLSESFLREMDEACEKFLDLFDRLKSEEDNVFENIQVLRKRLDLPEFILSKAQDLCPSERIKLGTKELMRLRELRLANLRQLMEACTLDLESIWQECYVSTDYRETFRQQSSMECTEDNLSKLEEEVNKWSHFKSVHQDFYDSLKVWLETQNRIRAIELQRQDPAVLKNRGGILLKLDKEDRKLRTRDLPNQTAHLETILPQECQGKDAELFALIRFEGQPLVGEKENCLASIIGKNLGSVSEAAPSASKKPVVTKEGFAYATGASKRPPTAAPRRASPPFIAPRIPPPGSASKKPRMDLHNSSLYRVG